MTNRISSGLGGYPLSTRYRGGGVELHCMTKIAIGCGLLALDSCCSRIATVQIDEACGEVEAAEARPSWGIALWTSC
jgi:hypothetical protein